MSKTIDLDNQYIAHTYNRYPLTFKEGKGSILYDEDGKKYINATNVLMNATWVYNPEENTISVSHDNTNTL